MPPFALLMDSTANTRNDPGCRTHPPQFELSDSTLLLFSFVLALFDVIGAVLAFRQIIHRQNISAGLVMRPKKEWHRRIFDGPHTQHCTLYVCVCVQLMNIDRYYPQITSKMCRSTYKRQYPSMDGYRQHMDMDGVRFCYPD